MILNIDRSLYPELWPWRPFCIHVADELAYRTVTIGGARARWKMLLYYEMQGIINVRLT